ncbi:MAG: ribonuclease HI [Clostridiales bacterium]|nr:ribonuclease HI [Clostridiales bacterium]
MTFLNIYTDGACSGNQSDENVGGWGAILEYGSHQKEIFGGESNTTNNRMEMTALLRAFEALTKEGQPIKVFSDSSYLINCFKEKWYENWLKNGWRTSDKKPVENQDLWEAMLPYLKKHRIEFYRVKGHINLNSKRLNIEPLFHKFLESNGNLFTLDDFKYIVEMNNRADALANKGIESIRDSETCS